MTISGIVGVSLYAEVNRNGLFVCITIMNGKHYAIRLKYLRLTVVSPEINGLPTGSEFRKELLAGRLQFWKHPAIRYARNREPAELEIADSVLPDTTMWVSWQDAELAGLVGQNLLAPGYLTALEIVTEVGTFRQEIVVHPGYGYSESNQINLRAAKTCVWVRKEGVGRCYDQGIGRHQAVAGSASWPTRRHHRCQDRS